MTDPNVWARRREAHSTPETRGMLCDMCPNLSCIRQDKSRLHPYRYFCESSHSSMTLGQMYAMTTETCPDGRVRTRGRFR